MNGFDLIIFALNFKFKFEMKICLRLRREGGRGLVLSCIDCRVLSSREEVVDVEDLRAIVRGGGAYYTLRGDHVKSQFLTHVNGEIG